MRTSVIHDFDIPANEVHGFKVLLDGEDISNDCVEADTDLGFAICYVRAGNGDPILDTGADGYKFRLKLLTGNIRMFNREGRELK